MRVINYIFIGIAAIALYFWLTDRTIVHNLRAVNDSLQGELDSIGLVISNDSLYYSLRQDSLANEVVGVDSIIVRYRASSENLRSIQRTLSEIDSIPDSTYNRILRELLQ